MAACSRRVCMLADQYFCNETDKEGKKRKEFDGLTGIACVCVIFCQSANPSYVAITSRNQYVAEKTRVARAPRVTKAVRFVTFAQQITYYRAANLDNQLPFVSL